jgi:RHS repeat-associated protein
MQRARAIATPALPAIAGALAPTLTRRYLVAMEGPRQREPQAWRTRAAGDPRRPGAVTRRTPVQVAGSRYYSPGLGRWTNRDPIGEDGGIPLCCMVGNNPVVRYDFLGLGDPTTDCVSCAVYDAKRIFALTGGSVTDVFRADVLAAATWGPNEREMQVYEVKIDCYRDGRKVHGEQFFGLRDVIIEGSPHSVSGQQRMAALAGDPKREYFDALPDSFACDCGQVKCQMMASFATRIHSHSVWRPSPQDLGALQPGETQYLLVAKPDGTMYYIPYTDSGPGSPVQLPQPPAGRPPNPPSCARR